MRWIKTIVGIMGVLSLISGNVFSGEKPEESKIKKQLLGKFSVYPGDNDTICEVEGLPLTRREIRRQTIFFRDLGAGLPLRDPVLTPDEALQQSLPVAVLIKAQDAEAIRRGIEVSIEDATFVRDMQREICQQGGKECLDLIEILSEAEGITVDEYWEAAINGYQESTRRLRLMDRALEEEGPGINAPPEEQREFYAKWEQELLERASIRWFDREMNDKYPKALKWYKEKIKKIDRMIEDYGQNP